MSFTDPTGGAGYGFGEQLPSSHMSTIAIQQVRAYDIVDGGTFGQTENVVVETASNKSISHNKASGATATAMTIALHELNLNADEVKFGTGEIKWDTAINLKRIIPMAPLNSPDAWSFQSGFGIYGFGTGSSSRITFQIPQIAWCTLKEVHVTLNGDNTSIGDRTAVPAVTPSITVQEVTSSGGVSTLATINHPVTAGSSDSGDITSYNGSHDLAATGLSGIMNSAVSPGYHHILNVFGETGADSKTDNRLVIRNMYAVYELSRIDQ